jgi:hypothetical protein
MRSSTAEPPPGQRIRNRLRPISPQRPWSELVSWAREELNLRPLPCQIQRVPPGLYVGQSEMGKDQDGVAGQRVRHPSDAPTIRHGSSAVVMISTPVGCCPSAARTGQAPAERTVSVGLGPPQRLRFSAGGTDVNGRQWTDQIRVSLGPLRPGTRIGPAGHGKADQEFSRPRQGGPNCAWTLLFVLLLGGLRADHEFDLCSSSLV